MSPLDRAIDICGSQKSLAKKIRVSPVFVSQMNNGVKAIPARLCIPIEDATNGEVTRYDLRPDIFGDPSNKTDTAA